MRKKLSLVFVVTTCLTICLTICLTMTLAIGPVAGQVPTMLLLEDYPVPGAPTQIISSLTNSAVNHAGGYSFGLNASDGTVTLAHFWGNPAGGPGMVLRTEGTFGIYTQTSFESFFGMSNDGSFSYSPSSENNVTGTTGLDGVWLNDDVVAIEEEPYPHDPAFWWSFGSRPGTTADAVPYWVGGITDTQGGSTDNRGLFYSTAATPVLLGGDFVTGLPDPLDTASTVSFDYRFSALGTHYIAEVQTLTGSTTNNNHMVSDGAVILLGGSPVSEATVIPPEVGGIDGEAWDNFDYTGYTESGQWFFSGDTDGATATDEIIVVDGVILYREGMTLGGYLISGSIESAYMNEDGDLAFIWDIEDPTQGNIEALFIGDQLLLKEGDPVDLDGDLVPDIGTAITDFTGINAMTISDRTNGMVNIYFTADVDIDSLPGAGGDTIGDEIDPEIALNPEKFGMSQEDFDNLEIPASDPTRVNLEGAFCMSVPTVVSTFLTSFEVSPSVSSVSVTWSVHAGGDPVEFRLLAHQGDTERDVSFQTDGNGHYSAHDELVQSGQVTYSLYYRESGLDWTQLGQESVSVEIPTVATKLLNAKPNPFNPHTDIAFSVDRAQHVRIALYDMSGRLVRVLAEEVFTVGTHQVPWDGKDDSGHGVSSGTYLVQMETAGHMDKQKIMLVR